MFYYLNKTCRFFSGCFHLPVPATIVLTADTFLHAVTTYQHLVIFLMHFSGDVHLSVPVTTALILEKVSLLEIPTYLLLTLQKV